jgi:hypothetical protein
MVQEALVKHFGETLAAIFRDETARTSRDVVCVNLKDAAKRASLSVALAAKIVRLAVSREAAARAAGLDVSYDRPRKGTGARLRGRGRPRVFAAHPALVTLRKLDATPPTPPRDPCDALRRAGIPVPEGATAVSYVMGSESWWVQTADGRWLWWDARQGVQDRVWKPADYGPWGGH